jgi:hypothetical protein
VHYFWDNPRISLIIPPLGPVFTAAPSYTTETNLEMSTLYVAMKSSVLYVVLTRNVSNIHTKIKAPVQGQHIPQ